MTDEKKPVLKKEEAVVSEEKKKAKKTEETLSNGLPEEVDFKKLLGCGG